MVKPDPAFPGETQVWIPIVNVALIHGHAKSRRFEAVVDSGSPRCLFHAGIGEAIGIQVTKGRRGSLSGVVGSAAPANVYYHHLKLVIFTEIIPITAGFSYELPVAGILGRTGFFESYKITFDPTSEPPGMEIVHVSRA